MVAEAGRGHARAEAEVRSRAEGAHPGPDEGALTLIRGPGMEVIRGHYRTESRLFGRLAPIQKIRGMELLEHRRVANGARGFHEASFVGSTSARVLSGACHLNLTPNSTPSISRVMCLDARCNGLRPRVVVR